MPRDRAGSPRQAPRHPASLPDAAAPGPDTEARSLDSIVDHSPDPQPKVPDWLAQSASLGWRLLVVVAFGLVVLAGTAVLGTVVASVVLAAAVTAAFDPLAERLRAAGRSPVKVAGLVTLAAIGIGVATLAVIAVALVPATLDVLRALDAGIDRLERLLDVGAISAPLASLVTEVIDGIKDWVSGALSIVVAAVASTATIVLLAVFLVFFLVTDADRAIAWTLQLAEPRQREQIRAATVTARRRLGRSLRETGVRATVMGTVALVVAIVLGLPAPLALAVLVFVGGFVPLLGLVAATAAIGLVALGASGGLAAVVAVTALAVATVLLPRVLGSGRWAGHGVHPALVLVALTGGRSSPARSGSSSPCRSRSSSGRSCRQSSPPSMERPSLDPRRGSSRAGSTGSPSGAGGSSSSPPWSRWGSSRCSRCRSSWSPSSSPPSSRPRSPRGSGSCCAAG